MITFKEICIRVFNALKKSGMQKIQSLTHRTRNDFVIAVYDALKSDKKDLKQQELAKLRELSRAYSFYKLSEDEAAQEAYNNGFVYGLTRLCELAAEDASAEENAIESYRSMSDEMRRSVRIIIRGLKNSVTTPKYEDIARWLQRTEGRVSQIMSNPGVALLFDVKQLGREKRISLSQYGEALAKAIEDKSDPDEELNTDKLFSVVENIKDYAFYPEDYDNSTNGIYYALTCKSRLEPNYNEPAA